MARYQSKCQALLSWVGEVGFLTAKGTSGSVMGWAGAICGVEMQLVKVVPESMRVLRGAGGRGGGDGAGAGGGGGGGAYCSQPPF